MSMTFWFNAVFPLYKETVKPKMIFFTTLFNNGFQVTCQWC